MSAAINLNLVHRCRSSRTSARSTRILQCTGGYKTCYWWWLRETSTVRNLLPSQCCQGCRAQHRDVTNMVNAISQRLQVVKVEWRSSSHLGILVKLLAEKV